MPSGSAQIDPADAKEAASGGPMIEFRGVAKVYPDGTEALKGVSLAVPRGQFCVILGPSGAGKSTLLRMLNGMAEPSVGEVSVDGLAMGRRNRRAIQARVAMIHQQFNLVPRLSVLHNALSGALREVALPAALFGWFPQRLRRRACYLLDKVGIREHQIHRRAAELSGGQQQRVGIARAFILAPRVVLADEPVASLDPKISRDILGLLRAAASEEGATVICSLHQVDLAREYADRVVGLHEGEIVYDGPAAKLDEATLDLIYSAGKGDLDADPPEEAVGPLPTALPV